MYFGTYYYIYLNLAYYDKYQKHILAQKARISKSVESKPSKVSNNKLKKKATNQSKDDSNIPNTQKSTEKSENADLKSQIQMNKKGK